MMKKDKDVKKELDKTLNHLHAANKQIRDMDGNLVKPEESRNVLLGGPVLWRDEAGAIFERDNPDITNLIRFIVQEMHKNLKG